MTGSASAHAGPSRYAADWHEKWLRASAIIAIQRTFPAILRAAFFGLPGDCTRLKSLRAPHNGSIVRPAAT